VPEDYGDAEEVWKGVQSNTFGEKKQVRPYLEDGAMVEVGDWHARAPGERVRWKKWRGRCRKAGPFRITQFSPTHLSGRG
jgi:hypothetical protein